MGEGLLTSLCIKAKGSKVSDVEIGKDSFDISPFKQLTQSQMFIFEL